MVFHICDTFNSLFHRNILDQNFFALFRKRHWDNEFFFSCLVDKTNNTTSYSGGFRIGWDHTRFRLQAANFEFEFWRWRGFPCLELICWFWKKEKKKVQNSWKEQFILEHYFLRILVCRHLIGRLLNWLLLVLIYWCWWNHFIAQKMLNVITCLRSFSVFELVNFDYAVIVMLAR